MRNFIKLLRPKQYIKNIIILLPIFFSGKLKESDKIAQAIVGFIAFSCACSIVYIVNDIKDIDKDRKHPTKCKRPLASGKVSKKQAIIIAICLLAVVIVFITMMKINMLSVLWMCIYLCVNFLYSFWGKRVAVMDIALLGMCYPIRLMYGGALTGTEISVWLFLTVLFVASYLACGKRYGEHVKVSSEGTRDVLKEYSGGYLEANMYLNLALGIVFYSFWALEKGKYFVYTVPLVMVICMKYNHLIDVRTDGDPIDTIFASKTLIVFCSVYLVVMILLVYGKFI